MYIIIFGGLYHVFQSRNMEYINAVTLTFISKVLSLFCIWILYIVC